MARKLLHFPASALLFVSIIFSSTWQRQQHGPDLVLFNARVMTLDSAGRMYRVVAVKDGRIIGLDDSILPAWGTPRMVWNAESAVIAPAFTDHHAHLFNIGMALLNQRDHGRLAIDLFPVRSLESGWWSTRGSSAGHPRATPERYIRDMTTPVSSTDETIALLDRERAAFLAQAARMPATRQAQRPTPDRWSVVEIMEHVARIDVGVGKLLALKTAEPTLASPQQLADAEFTPERIRRIRNRDERIEAPERVRPTGTLSPEAALANLASSRAALKTAFLAADPTVLDGVVHPHPVIGLLTLRGWVTLAAHHDARHAQQVAEIAEE